MATSYSQLGQITPSNTTATSIYSPGASETAFVKTVFVCNTGTSIVKYRLFHDDNGTTYGDATALAYDIELDPGRTHVWDVNILMNDSTGNLAGRTDTANDITFTAYGAVQS
jgi:hypothetical protein